MNEHELNIVVVNGAPEAGKDTFVDFCIEHLNNNNRFAMKASSVDRVKAAAKLLGWDGEKDAKGRKFLSDMKDLSTAAYDGPLQYMVAIEKKSRAMGAAALFLFIREPEEIARFISTFPHAKTVLVERGGTAHPPSNHADARVQRYSYDFTVNNYRDLSSLKSRAKEFLEEAMQWT